VLSVVLGAVAAWLAGSRVAAVRGAIAAFVQLFRNTPPLVQLYFFYFAVGPLLPKVDGVPLLGSFGWAVVSLTLLETAFAAEIFAPASRRCRRRPSKPRRRWVTPARRSIARSCCRSPCA
jgi:His/Glu/Gln/Arg/opine family amino acid ABC transporter permease subunit